MVACVNVVTPGEVDRIIEALEHDPDSLELVAMLVFHLANRRIPVGVEEPIPESLSQT